MKNEEIEMQMLNSQAQMIAEQMERIDAACTEIDGIKNNLDSLKNTKKETEILSPISNGIFVKAGIKDNEKLLVNVGGGVVVEKTVEEAKNLLDARIIEMEEAKDKLAAQMQKIEEKLSKLEK